MFLKSLLKLFELAMGKNFIQQQFAIYSLFVIDSNQLKTICSKVLKKVKYFTKCFHFVR